MSRRKKIGIRILAAFIVTVIVAIMAVRCHLSNKETQAAEIAKDYLEQKYTQGMIFRGIRFSWIDPAVYHAFFSPENNQTLVIEVIVSMDLTMDDERVYGNHNYTNDDYYMAYFGQQIAEYFTDSVHTIWGDNASAYAVAYNHALGSFANPVGLNDQLSLDEMEALIEDYGIYINAELLLYDGNVQEEAEKILTFIDTIRESGYEPERLIMRYLAHEDSKNDSDLTIIGLYDLQDIVTADFIVEQLKSGLAEGDS